MLEFAKLKNVVFYKRVDSVSKFEKKYRRDSFGHRKSSENEKMSVFRGDFEERGGRELATMVYLKERSG